MGMAVAVVLLWQARKLLNVDAVGKSDPYVVCTVGTASKWGKVFDNSLSPVFHDWYAGVCLVWEGECGRSRPPNASTALPSGRHSDLRSTCVAVPGLLCTDPCLQLHVYASKWYRCADIVHHHLERQRPDVVRAHWQRNHPLHP